MQEIMMEPNNKANGFKAFINLIINLWKNIWSDRKKCFLFLMVFLFLIVTILMLYPIYYNTFLNCNTDDILQYYPYIVGFFDKIKHGKLSLYDTTLFGGSSFFGGVYYIPLDIFLGLAFFLSYIMPTEAAYCLTNLLRPVVGALLIYIIFSRKGYKIKTCFIASIIFFVGGMTEAYFVFPVFLGICCYAPLGMLLVDLCIEKKGFYYLFIPIYGLIIILYDFYIAYMLFAFICVYFVVAMHMRLNKFFLINKEFWLRFLEFMLLILLGLLIAMFFLLPSALYVIFESGRGSQSNEYNIWYYALSNGKDLSIRHYFTQWCNYFIPNTPFNLALIKPGDYIREHASMYLTSGGLLYLAYFFIIGGKQNHRLKFWIVLLNLMFCIPLCAMIFTFNDWAYVRWFFIPYMLSFYGMVRGMEYNSFKIGNNKYIKIIPYVLLILGLSTLIYVLIAKPEIYIHYEASDMYYYPILIGSIICISIYIILAIITFILESCKKNCSIMYKLFPLVIFAEAIFACFIAFSTVGGQNQYSKNNELLAQKEHFYSLGYNETDGYRINLSTKLAKNTLNANIMLRDVNHSRVFQSFVNTPLRVYYEDMHHDNIGGWNHSSMHGYNILSGAMFNIKYIATDYDFFHYLLDENYYEILSNHKINNKEINYYQVKDSFQFIVYDTIFTKTSVSGISSEPFINDVALLSYAYAKIPYDNESYEELDPNNDEDKVKIKQYDMYDKIIDAGLKEKSIKEIYKDISSNYSYTTCDKYVYEDGFYKYDLNSKAIESLFENCDFIYISSKASGIVAQDFFQCYLHDENSENGISYYPVHYNLIHANRYPFMPTGMWVSGKENAYATLKLYGFNYDIYDSYVQKQNEFTQREFSINNDQIRIKFKNNNSDAKIVKTGYTYSDDWIVADEKYQTCNINGGFLGILVPEGEEYIDITLNYKPIGFEAGCKISIIGCIIYLVITGSAVIYIIIKRRGCERK